MYDAVVAFEASPVRDPVNEAVICEAEILVMIAVARV
jgi:hypothetical protein